MWRGGSLWRPNYSISSRMLNAAPCEMP
jgi:hypothetical protein